MANVVINDAHLIAIGDSLRSKLGETKIENVLVSSEEYMVAATTGATEGLTTLGSGAGAYASQMYYKYTFPNAASIKVVISGYKSTSSTELKILEGAVNTGGASGTNIAGTYEVGTVVNKEFTFNSDSFTIYSYTTRVYYYAKVYGYDALGNQITLDTYGEQEVANTFKPREMAGAIDELAAPPDAIVLTGEQDYGCAGVLSSAMIEMFPDKISTSEVTKGSYMFYNYSLSEIPFEINCNANNSDRAFNNMFDNAKITKAPVINGGKIIGQCNAMFNKCEYLTDISEVANYPFYINSGSGKGSFFMTCKRLRQVPAEVLKNLQSTIGYSYQNSNCHTTRLVSDCYSLESVEGVNPPTYTNASSALGTYNNMFDYMVDNTYRLSHFVFATNEDGSPLVRDNYTNQTLDFDGYVGYAPNASTMTGLDFTTDTQVTDLASYEALKDNPDWWTINKTFSRFNHDSAVELINSLPDVSSSGATTNKLLLLGTMGSGYGKAISDLTEDEIAVATAKGWVVTIS